MNKRMITERNFTTADTKSPVQVVDFYDQYAESWDQRFKKSSATTRFFDSRWESFLDVLGPWQPHGQALELGVGTGVYIERASKLFDHIVAVDASAQMLNKLKEKIDGEIKNVEVKKCFAENLEDIPCDFFDVVYFFGVIEHIIKTDLFVGEIHRVLKPGGRVIGIMPNRWSPWYYLLRKYARGTGAHCSSDRYYSSREIKIIFTSRGFDDARIRYWGSVPAGIDGKLVTKFLEAVETFSRYTYMDRFLGGITFGFSKV